MGKRLFALAVWIGRTRGRHNYGWCHSWRCALNGHDERNFLSGERARPGGNWCSRCKNYGGV